MKTPFAFVFATIAFLVPGIAAAQWTPSPTTQVEPIETITVYGSLEETGGEGMISYSFRGPINNEVAIADQLIDLLFFATKLVQAKCVSGEHANVTSRSPEYDRQAVAQAALSSTMFPALQRFLGLGSFRVIFADGGFEDYNIAAPGYAIAIQGSVGLRDGNPNNETCHDNPIG